MEADANQLIKAAAAGQNAAAEQLIGLFYERIYGFLRRLTANEADAADLTQRTFTRVWQGLSGFAGQSSVSSWIHSIAYHAYVDWRRADHRGEPRSDEWWSQRAHPETGPDEMLARTDLAGIVYATVDRLEPDLRTTVHLHYYQELTLQETADAMQVATSTVKYRLRLAIEQLQKLLPPEPSVTKPLTVFGIV